MKPGVEVDGAGVAVEVLGAGVVVFTTLCVGVALAFVVLVAGVVRVCTVCRRDELVLGEAGEVVGPLVGSTETDAGSVGTVVGSTLAETCGSSATAR